LRGGFADLQGLASLELIPQLGFALCRGGQRILLLDDRVVAGVFYAPGFGSIELDGRLKIGRHIGFGVNRFDGALGNTGCAIDAILGVDDKLVVHFVKAGHRADFDAVGELAILTFTGNDVGHSGDSFGCSARFCKFDLL
jgi:hypothetical protein